MSVCMYVVTDIVNLFDKNGYENIFFSLTVYLCLNLYNLRSVYILNICYRTCTSKTVLYQCFNRPLNKLDSTAKRTVLTRPTFYHFARCLTLGTARRDKLNCDTKTREGRWTKETIVARWKTVTR